MRVSGHTKQLCERQDGHEEERYARREGFFLLLAVEHAEPAGKVKKEVHVEHLKCHE